MSQLFTNIQSTNQINTIFLNINESLFIFSVKMFQQTVLHLQSAFLAGLTPLKQHHSELDLNLDIHKFLVHRKLFNINPSSSYLPQILSKKLLQNLCKYYHQKDFLCQFSFVKNCTYYVIFVYFYFDFDWRKYMTIIIFCFVFSIVTLSTECIRDSD